MLSLIQLHKPTMALTLSSQSLTSPIPDDELLQVIVDFLALGHVDNIVAMFRQETRYYQWTGRMLADNRYSVRLGVSVLFERLAILCPEDVALAIPSLAEQLDNPIDWIRGEAVSVLGLIGTEDAISLVRSQLLDSSPQVVEVVRDILGLPT